MKKTAVLINTARGELIDEAALVQALREGKIAAAGLDVFREEPPKNPEIYQLDNLIMGAHCAASTPGRQHGHEPRGDGESSANTFERLKEGCNGILPAHMKLSKQT